MLNQDDNAENGFLTKIQTLGKVTIKWGEKVNENIF